MVRVDFSSPDAFKYSATVKRAGLRVTKQLEVTTRHHGQMLLTAIRARASGRPGPRAPTGDYRRSWGMQMQRSGTEVSAVVGTNAPQGRRLEFGFNGVDSLGRSYNQPPYPHVEPAMAVVGPQFFKSVERIVDTL